MLCPAARGRLYTIVHDLVGTCRTVLRPAHQHTTPLLLPAAGSSQSSLVHDLRGHVHGLHPLGSAAGGAGDLSHCPALQAEPAATLCRWGLLLPVCINARVSVRDRLSALPHRLCCSSSRRTFESAACSAGLAVHSEDPDLVHIAAVALVCFMSVAVLLCWRPMGPFLCPARCTCCRSPGLICQSERCVALLTTGSGTLLAAC